MIFFVRWSLEKEIWLKIFQSSFLSSSSWKFLDDYSLLKEWLEKKIIVRWYKIDHHFAKIIHLVKRSSFDMFVDIGTVNQRKNKFLLSELSWISLSRLLRLEHYTVSFIGIFRSYEARNQCEHVGWPSIIILVFWPKIHMLLPFCDNMTLYMTSKDNITSIFISYDNSRQTNENVINNWYIAFRKNISTNNEFVLTFRYVLYLLIKKNIFLGQGR